MMRNIFSSHFFPRSRKLKCKEILKDGEEILLQREPLSRLLLASSDEGPTSLLLQPPLPKVARARDVSGEPEKNCTQLYDDPP